MAMILEQGELLRKGLCGFCALLFGAMLFLICTKSNVLPRLFQGQEELKAFLAKKGKETAWYGKKEAWLLKKGAGFHFWKNITPQGFLLLQVLAGFFGGLLLARESAFMALAVGLGLFFLPDWLVVSFDRADNEKMLPQIRLIYNALEIQVRSGVYLTDALIACYGSVEEGRLQAALLDLSGALTIKADVYEALNDFGAKFDNRYVDSLCMVILQALESGQAAALFRDIAEQVKDMESQVLQRKKARLERHMTFLQLGMLSILLGFSVYVIVQDLLSMAGGGLLW